MDEAYIGTIVIWPLDWAPVNWMLCKGQELQVNQYMALYSLIGITYGGKANETFNLPNLCGRVPIGAGQGEGLTNKELGEKSGFETNTISSAQLPPHNHSAELNNSKISNGTINNGKWDVTINVPANAKNVKADIANPGPDTYLAQATYGLNNGSTANMYTKSTPDITLGQSPIKATGTIEGTINGNVNGEVVINNTGNGLPVNNMQPYLTLNYIICVHGLYPPRP
ncbi:phage tail protein [Lysinibacillus sp. 3P01SB]|uniref:phage tail protein n=1 Tax=Lysinibacillus sp. 3P01SB TaxID=3132284 RepID=UPI0039A48446